MIFILFCMLLFCVSSQGVSRSSASSAGQNAQVYSSQGRSSRISSSTAPRSKYSRTSSTINNQKDKNENKKNNENTIEEVVTVPFSIAQTLVKEFWGSSPGSKMESSSIAALEMGAFMLLNKMANTPDHPLNSILKTFYAKFKNVSPAEKEKLLMLTTRSIIDFFKKNPEELKNIKPQNDQEEAIKKILEEIKNHQGNINKEEIEEILKKYNYDNNNDRSKKLLEVLEKK